MDDPEVAVRAEVAGGTRVVRGAAAVASQALGFASRARSARPALVLRFAFTGDLIARIEVLSSPGRLARLELAELDG